MIVKGSLNYTSSGRKKHFQRRKKKHYEFKELKLRNSETQKYYPSRISRSCETTKKSFPTGGAYTVAPAYNKGAYQLIPLSDIKYIGK